MEEPLTPVPRPCSVPHSAPVAWLAGPAPAPSEVQANETKPSEAAALRAAIDLVLAHPDAVAEVLTRARSHPVRHDGWTGERMAAFLEVLADTGIVTEACRAAGMSRDGAYAFRNRDPVFAAAWRAAETKARPQVSDGLLERSITGTVEHYYRDGVLVGQRRHYESWLGLAVLKRLDKLAEEDRRAQRVRGTGEHDDAGNALAARMAGDWQGTLDMLRGGGTAALPAMFAPKVDKVDTPPSPPRCDAFESCWKAGSQEDPKPGRERGLPDGTWITTFPPPPGFDGYENAPWDGFAWYERACTPEEAGLLDAHEAAAEAREQAELTGCAESERDRFFATLRSDLAAADLAPGGPLRSRA